MSVLIIKRVLLNLYVNEGMTYQELADRFNCSKTYIERQLKTIPGFKPRKRGSRSFEQNNLNLSHLRGLLNHDAERSTIEQLTGKSWAEIQEFALQRATYEFGRYLHRQRTKAA